VSFAALLTPPGRGALATIGLVDAWPVLRELFRTRAGKELPEVPEPGRHWLGRIGTDMADECVLAVRSTDRVEAHVHGGEAVTGWLLELLQDKGVRIGSCEEWLSSKAWRMLAHAPTERTAAILLDQIHGPREPSAERRAALAGVGRHLVEPWRVAVAGEPNVGKSSLVNAIAGHERCVVSPTPGTTRDAVAVRVAIDGWPVELIDTAGVREASEAVEREGVALARETAAAADLVLWVVDATREAAPAPAGAMVVRNKIDLAGGPGVSAVTGEGLEELLTTIARRLVPESPLPGEAVPLGE
jgi:tRNA modification GTPase